MVSWPKDSSTYYKGSEQQPAHFIASLNPQLWWVAIIIIVIVITVIIVIIVIINISIVIMQNYLDISKKVCLRNL